MFWIKVKKSWCFSLPCSSLLMANFLQEAPALHDRLEWPEAKKHLAWVFFNKISFEDFFLIIFKGLKGYQFTQQCIILNNLPNDINICWEKPIKHKKCPLWVSSKNKTYIRYSKSRTQSFVLHREVEKGQLFLTNFWAQILRAQKNSDSLCRKLINK